MTNFLTPTAQKARDYVIESLKEIEQRDDWEFLRDTVTALSWTSPGIATLPAHQRIHAVQYLVPDASASAVNRVYVTFLDTPSFARLNPTPLTTNDRSYYPNVYTILDDARVQIHPYPNDITTQNRVTFHITRTFTLPTLISDFLPIPERLTPLVVRLASSLMATRHLGDGNMGQMYRGEYEALLRMVRAREQRTPTPGTNMFRRRVPR